MTEHAEVVVITGATSGIGLELGREFRKRGAHVYAAGRSVQGLQDIAREGLATLHVDVRDEQSLRNAAESVRTHEGGIDTLICNAGVQRLVAFDDPAALESADLEEEVGINLLGTLFSIRAFLSLLRGRANARIVIVGSGLGYVPLVAAPIYSATKAAVHAFAVALREQLRDSGIQVVLLAPPAVETQLHRHMSRRPPKIMPLKDFVSHAMRGLDARHDNVVVGLARVLQFASRVAPTLFLRKVVNRRPKLPA